MAGLIPWADLAISAYPLIAAENDAAQLRNDPQFTGLLNSLVGQYNQAAQQASPAGQFGVDRSGNPLTAGGGFQQTLMNQAQFVPQSLAQQQSLINTAMQQMGLEGFGDALSAPQPNYNPGAIPGVAPGSGFQQIPLFEEGEGGGVGANILGGLEDVYQFLDESIGGLGGGGLIGAAGNVAGDIAHAVSAVGGGLGLPDLTPFGISFENFFREGDITPNGSLGQNIYDTFHGGPGGSLDLTPGFSLFRPSTWFDKGGPGAVGGASGGPGAGVGGQVPSFQTGTLNVPQDGLAQLHAGEAVIPAAQNPFGFGGPTKAFGGGVGQGGSNGVPFDSTRGFSHTGLAGRDDFSRTGLAGRDDFSKPGLAGPGGFDFGALFNFMGGGPQSPDALSPFAPSNFSPLTPGLSPEIQQMLISRETDTINRQSQAGANMLREQAAGMGNLRGGAFQQGLVQNELARQGNIGALRQNVALSAAEREFQETLAANQFTQSQDQLRASNEIARGQIGADVFGTEIQRFLGGLGAGTDIFGVQTQADTSRFLGNLQAGTSRYGMDTQVATSRFIGNLQADTSRALGEMDAHTALSLGLIDAETARIGIANNFTLGQMGIQIDREQLERMELDDANQLIAWGTEGLIASQDQAYDRISEIATLLSEGATLTSDQANDLLLQIQAIQSGL